MKHILLMMTFIGCCAYCAVALKAEVKVPGFYTDNMVIQREVEFPVWGWASAGEKVNISLGDQTQSTTAGTDGTWRVKFAPRPASKEAVTLKVSGSNTLTFNELVFGDVWLCSGQSNMEWRVRSSTNAQQEIQQANYPLIRQLLISKDTSVTPKSDLKANWTKCSPETAGDYTAAGYFMARKLHRDLDIPIGLIHSSWGGTRIEPWTPVAGFEQVDELKSLYESILNRTPGSAQYHSLVKGYIKEIENWKANAEKSLQEKNIVAASPVFPEAVKPMSSHQDPVALYNAMIHPVVGYPLKGIIWYQGESNMSEGMQYRYKMEALIKGWRTVWKQPELPFYFVQIAPFRYNNNNPGLLAEFWEAQGKAAAEIPNTGMIVINDVATINDIHPPYKQAVGERLALLALHRTYGKKDVVDSGPVFKKLTIEGDKLRVQFDNIAAGLKSRDGKPLTHFEVIGLESGWEKAEAVIEDDCVILSSKEVKSPVAMRFAWEQLAEPNLSNSAGLPAGAFRAGEVPKIDAARQIKELKEYELVYDADLSKLAHDINYDLDRSNDVKSPISRIAYLLELQSDKGSPQFVCVSMDAFTQDVKKIGIPQLSAKSSFQQNIKNMNVSSNVNGIQTGTGIAGGNIEFWPNNYATGNAGGTPNASNDFYDWGDAKFDPVDGYGCMQIHNHEAKQVIFAINHWTAGGGAEMGIGNCTVSEQKDWTFTGNAGTYTSKRLRVYVKP